MKQQQHFTKLNKKKKEFLFFTVGFSVVLKDPIFRKTNNQTFVSINYLLLFKPCISSSNLKGGSSSTVSVVHESSSESSTDLIAFLKLSNSSLDIVSLHQRSPLLVVRVLEPQCVYSVCSCDLNHNSSSHMLVPAPWYNPSEVKQRGPDDLASEPIEDPSVDHLEVEDLEVLVGKVHDLQWVDSVVVFHIPLGDEGGVIVVPHVVVVGEDVGGIGSGGS